MFLAREAAEAAEEKPRELHRASFHLIFLPVNQAWAIYFGKGEPQTWSLLEGPAPYEQIKARWDHMWLGSDPGGWGANEEEEESEANDYFTDVDATQQGAKKYHATHFGGGKLPSLYTPSGKGYIARKAFFRAGYYHWPETGQIINELPSTAVPIENLVHWLPRGAEEAEEGDGYQENPRGPRCGPDPMSGKWRHRGGCCPGRPTCRQQRKEEGLCHCEAYHYPHRSGSGDCLLGPEGPERMDRKVFGPPPDNGANEAREVMEEHEEVWWRGGQPPGTKGVWLTTSKEYANFYATRGHTKWSEPAIYRCKPHGRVLDLRRFGPHGEGVASFLVKKLKISSARARRFEKESTAGTFIGGQIHQTVESYREYFRKAGYSAVRVQQHHFGLSREAYDSLFVIDPHDVECTQVRDGKSEGAHEAREQEEPAGEAAAVPWVKLERDPERYRRQMARAKEIGEVDSDRAIYDLLAPALAKEDQEVFLVLAIDARKQCRDVVEVHRGGQSRVAVEIPVIMRAANAIGGEMFVVVHNHPTGNAKPSAADRRLTKAIEKAARTNELVFMDHVIVGLDQYYSFAADQLVQVPSPRA
jgi:hypothetical protein